MLIEVLHWPLFIFIGPLLVPCVQEYTFISLIASNSAEDPEGVLSSESLGPFTRFAWKFMGLNLQQSFGSFCLQNFMGSEPQPDPHFNSRSYGAPTLTLSPRTSERNLFYNAFIGD